MSVSTRNSTYVCNETRLQILTDSRGAEGPGTASLTWPQCDCHLMRAAETGARDAARRGQLRALCCGAVRKDFRFQHSAGPAGLK